MLAAGVAGTWTLPQFGFAFIATGLALAYYERTRRRRLLVGLGVSIALVLAWYAPHLGRVRDAPSIEDGVQINPVWLATAPIDQILLPSLLWIDGTALVAGVVWLPLIVVSVLVIVASPLARERMTALVLTAGPVATVVVRMFRFPQYARGGETIVWLVPPA